MNIIHLLHKAKDITYMFLSGINLICLWILVVHILQLELISQYIVVIDKT